MLLHFALLDFYKLKVCGNTPSRKSNSICLLRLSVGHFGNSHNISGLFTMIIFVTVICDQ